MEEMIRQLPAWIWPGILCLAVWDAVWKMIAMESRKAKPDCMVYLFGGLQYCGTASHRLPVVRKG
ncbi:MAG: hypothetical protein LIO77_08320 [Rikenellaceae bacterium]|nr:hypothetical protein [Rikenellaceae bacterium]